MAIGHLVIGTGDERRDIGRKWRSGCEANHLRTARTSRAIGRSTVRDNLPVGGRGDRQRKCRLEVRLVKAGVHPLGIGGLELRVQVDGAVHRIDKSVQALTGIRVAADGFDDERVVLGQRRQHQTGLGCVAARVEPRAVESRFIDALGDQVHKGSCAALVGAEVHGRAGAKRLPARLDPRRRSDRGRPRMRSRRVARRACARRCGSGWGRPSVNSVTGPTARAWRLGVRSLDTAPKTSWSPSCSPPRSPRRRRQPRARTSLPSLAARACASRWRTGITAPSSRTASATRVRTACGTSRTSRTSPPQDLRIRPNVA